jgi:hypothetical protein
MSETRESLMQRALCRLAFIRELLEDWDSYGAVPTSDTAAEAAVKVLERVVKDDAPTPQLCPMTDGGVDLEWLVGDDYASIECNADGRLSFYAQIDKRDEWEVEGIAFDDADELFGRIAALLDKMAPNVRYRLDA